MGQKASVTPPKADRLDTDGSTVAPHKAIIPLSTGGSELVLPSPDTSDPNECPIQTIESLRNHLRAAIAVELSTIPLYLYALYTIKPPSSPVPSPPQAADAFRGIIKEEMLHLCLAGNVLKAVNGTPRLYGPHLMPDYPMDMPGREPKLKMQLRAATKANLQTFIDIEKPMEPDGPAQPGTYNTLGQFYKAIKQGLAYLDAKYTKEGKKLFEEASKPCQFAPGLGYIPRVPDAGGLVIVENLTTAQEAIKIIVDQGEGSYGPYDDPSHQELAHYYIFLQLQQSMLEQWDTYDVPENPHTADYQTRNVDIYNVSRAFDAAYCYLLLTIEKLWIVGDESDRKKLVNGNLFGIMMGVLPPLARFLVQEHITGHPDARVTRAAPCFDFYDFDRRPDVTPFQQLLDELAGAAAGYVGKPEHDALVSILKQVESLFDLSKFS